MQSEQIELPREIAEALGLPSLAAEAVAERLAEIGGLHAPTRPETVEFLVATLQHAANQIPSVPAAWSWGEFHHAGIYASHELIQSEDPVGLAICASDLGLADEVTPDPAETIRQALSRGLAAATNRLLRSVTERLEAAGISTHGHRGFS